MKYFLDTNVISYLMKRESNCTRQFKTFSERGGTEMLVPVVAYYEIKRGLLACGATSKLRLFDTIVQMMSVMPFNRNAGDIAAKIYAQLRQSGTLIEDADIFIAASAMEARATLVTSNAKHMQRIDGLVVETWI